MFKFLRNLFSQLIRYPSAIIGLILISLFVMLALSAPLIMPYGEAIEHWRGTEEIVGNNPRNAKPLWVNWFRQEKLSRTIQLDGTDLETTRTQLSDELWETVTTYQFEYTADTFPNELSILLSPSFKEKAPYVEMALITPDGREIDAGQTTSNAPQKFRFSQDSKLIRKLGVDSAEEGFFLDPATEGDDAKPIKGMYTLIVTALHFEEGSTLESEFTLFGDVFGWAGTDHRRRDLMVSVIWGAPIAMAFGLIASLAVTFFGMIVAALGVWHGGWIDGLIQRIHEVFLALPVLVILLMIGTLYSRNIWYILGATIILSMFSSGIKSNRALFLQVRELGYIEAALTYGASSTRVIFRYLIPRVLPLIIPALISSVPTFVYIEATLAAFGLGDPTLPTWGKVIDDARSQGGVINGYYYWMVQPAVLLFFLGLGFSLLGRSLDRIFNPKLREI